MSDNPTIHNHPGDRSMNDDRTVHAISGHEQPYELVRYDRAGKWYIEGPSRRTSVSLAEAVEFADQWWRTGGTPYIGRRGGSRFDSLLRKRYPRCV